VTTEQSRLPVKTKIAYGFGSIAYGIKDNGFATFLLFYYNQVIGLRADLVGLAIALALVADACIDPVIGRLTDQTRTSIGRRHPWLYGAILPISAAWLFLWHPPEASETVQFLYLLIFAMLVRFSLSLMEVPALAMLPELSSDYHDRTGITRFRFLFGWGAGISIMALNYAVFLAPTEEYPVGLLNPDGYSKYAILGAMAMAIAVFVSAAGTHKRVVTAYHKSKDNIRSAETIGQMFATLRYKPFLLLLFAGVFAFTNQGIVFALNAYLLPHIWLLDQNGLFLYSVLLFVSVTIAFVTVTPLSQRLGKAKTASILTLVAMTLVTLPYWLRAFNAFPEVGSDMLLPILFSCLVLGTAASICAMILTISLMADVTDAYEHEHGEKSEGIFASGIWFMQKTVSAAGILIASLVISIAGLPERAAPGTVDDGILDNLSLIFASLTACIAIAGAWAYTLFPLSEADHKARLAQTS